MLLVPTVATAEDLLCKYHHLQCIPMEPKVDLEENLEETVGTEETMVAWMEHPSYKYRRLHYIPMESKVDLGEDKI